MQISKAVSTSDILIKPWCAFSQVSMTTMTTMLSCRSGCSPPAKIPNSAPCKPGFYQNHPQGVFPCEFITLVQTVRLSTSTSVLGVWSECWTSFPLFPLSLMPQNLWLRGQRPPRHPIYSHEVLQSVGTIFYNYRGKMYADLSNGWT